LKDYPFIKFTLLFVVGILLHRILRPDSVLLISSIIPILCLSLVLKIVVKKYQVQRLGDIILYITFVLLGLFIATQNFEELKTPLSKYHKEKKSILYAEIKNIELIKSYEIVFTVITDSIKLDNKTFNNPDCLIYKFRGDSIQREKLYAEIYPGNKIYVTGTYQKGRERRNPGEFDYDKYLNAKGVTGLFISYDTDSITIIDSKINMFASYLFALRKSIDEIIVNLHDKETSDLLRGLILADRSGIDAETKNAFVNSGVIHILAVSGLNVGYVILIFIIVFGRFSIYVRSILTVVGLIIFMLITGTTPPVVRATIMGIIIILTFLSNRSTNLFNSISIAAVIILFFSPQQIYDPGFQLSFGAVLSTAIIYPYLQSWIEKLNFKLKWIKKILLFMGVSLSAQLGTIPFTLIYFSKLSVVSIIANLFVIPISGIITAIAFLTIFLGSFSSLLAQYFAYANNLLTFIMMESIRFAGDLKFSFLWIRDYSLYDSIVFYVLLGLLLISLNRIQKTVIKISIIVFTFLIIIIYSSFDDKKLLTDDRLNVMMIDVGQGDSFLIKFPNGKTALIDAGEANPYIDNGERVIIPLLDNLSIDKIDYGFISHLDLDHYGGFISLIYNDRINEIYRPLHDSSTKSTRLEKFLKLKNIKTHIYDKSIIDIGNARVYILNNPYDKLYSSLSSNDKSGVLKIVYGKTSFLFVGDCEHPAEYYLASTFGNMLDSEVLKLGHHGSSTASSNVFLNYVSPDISLVSSGIKNKFNHPSKRVINSLEKLKSTIYRTDEIGAVVLQSDGVNIKYINWK
jgi:competence protein ComEC